MTTYTLEQLDALFNGRAVLNKLLSPLHEIRGGAVRVIQRDNWTEWLDEFWPDHENNPPPLNVPGKGIAEPVLTDPFSTADFLASLKVLSGLRHDLFMRFTRPPPGVEKYPADAVLNEDNAHDPTTADPAWVTGVLDVKALAALERVEPAFAGLLRRVLCTRPDWWRTPILVPSEPNSEPQRRLEALRAMGGNAKWFHGKWAFTGIVQLTEAEKAAGRPRSDQKTIRGDLTDAAEAERRQGKPQASSPWFPTR